METNCTICGGTYEYKNGKWICAYCGYPKPEELNNEEVTLLYQAGQKLRLQDFEEAEILFTDIIQKYPQNPEGYWGLVCAKYGIKYEEDYDGKKIPTCCLDTIPNFEEDNDYLKALAFSKGDLQNWYRSQAEYIKRVSKQWNEDASKEKPYDIFICFKDSDRANGIERTQDSYDAMEIYTQLQEKGYRVFMSRISLQDKTGEKYEPYIFNALQTAKVMLVFGSSVEYITSTWLQNEWKRYLKRMANGEKKKNSLVVAYKGFNPAQMPSILAKTQCLDFAKNDFYQRLLEYLKKVLDEEEPKRTNETKQAESSPVPRKIVVSEGHIHDYEATVVPPSCFEKGYTLHRCACGEEYRDTFTKTIEHDYRIQKRVRPTCEENGKEEYACSVCGEKKEEVLLAIGHSFTDWEKTKDGKNSRFCQNCGKEETTTIVIPTYQTYQRKEDYIYFGQYPQSKVTDAEIIERLNYMIGVSKPQTEIEAPTKIEAPTEVIPPKKQNKFMQLFLGKKKEKSSEQITNKAIQLSNEQLSKWTSYKYYVEGSNSTDFMWYINKEYNGNKYRGVYFTSYRPYSTTESSSADKSYQDDNGYYTSTVYWFKYEPIKWRILEEKDGYATILAGLILDSQEYYSENREDSFSHNGGTGYANNYALSNIRKWLNETFYNTAFSSLQQTLIQTVTVDNSARSTNPDKNATEWNSGDNEYSCSNTNDKVWLLSEQEVTRASYGFNTSPPNYDTARTKTTSDYARCQGAYTYDGKGYWWLRSPYCYFSYFAWYVYSDGCAYGRNSVSGTDIGVVPALKICLS